MNAPARAADVAARLAGQTPARLVLAAGDRRAAVAVVLADDGANGAAVLLIRRAARAGDPWSDQIALPGGGHDAGDLDTVATAARETSEETGVLLPRRSWVAAADELRVWRSGVPSEIVVSPHIFHVDDTHPPQPGPEAASARWVPLADLCHPDARATHTVGDRSFPAVVLGDWLIWGLTYRVLSATLTRADLWHVAEHRDERDCPST